MFNKRILDDSKRFYKRILTVIFILISEVISHIMVSINGIGVCSTGDEIVFATSLTAYIEGVKHKFCFLNIGKDFQAIGLIFSEISNFLRRKLGSHFFLEQKSQVLEPQSTSAFLAGFNERLVALNSGKMEYYFLRNRALEKLSIGKQLSGGWVILSSRNLDYKELQQINYLTEMGFTPKGVVEQFLRGKTEPLSLAVAAINVNVSDNRLIRGNPAFCCLSDVGFTRKNNEDACLTASFHLSTLNKTTSYRVLCVADGAGGHGHGEVASKEAILETFIQLGNRIIRKEAEADIQNMLRETINSANRRILEIKSRMMSNMATTLTMVFINGSDIYVGHVGDSRVYLADVETGNIMQLTRDHKYVEDLVERGLITKEEAKVHPQRNIITSALGMDNPRIDVLHYSNMFNGNSRVIVCSDGLSDLVDDEEISLQAIRRASPIEIAHSLIRLANERGGLDNISVVIDGYIL